MMRVLTLDLVDEPRAIAAYERWHTPGRVPAAVLASIQAGGITQMEIFRTGNRLVMVTHAAPGVDAGPPAAPDPAVAAWEARMGEFQRALPQAPHDSRWTPMAPIFRLTDHG